MYPILRMIGQVLRVRNAEPLPLMGTHVSRHICMPWDIDIFMELNNGRTLTLLDLGRIPLSFRAGLVDVLRSENWGMTMAGVSVRYRRRIRMFDRFETRSRYIGWDDKFIYLDQSMWRGETCCNQALYRSAITDKNGIVPISRVLEALGYSGPAPVLPDWVQHWIAAEASRPWPPNPAEPVPALAVAE